MESRVTDAHRRKKQQDDEKLVHERSIVETRHEVDVRPTDLMSGMGLTSRAAQPLHQWSERTFRRQWTS